jgi:hypothetical protein
VRSGGNDLYELLGVAHDASTSEIKRAYELALNRAHRDGAIRHAEDLVQAFATLADSRRRAAYDRHGLTPLHERSPGATPSVMPWRSAQSFETMTAAKIRRTWPVPVLSIFGLGIVVGIVLVVSISHPHGRESPSVTSPRIATHRSLVICSEYAGGPGYTWTAQPGQPITCSNGAHPHVTDGRR